MFGSLNSMQWLHICSRDSLQMLQLSNTESLTQLATAFHLVTLKIRLSASIFRLYYTLHQLIGSLPDHKFQQQIRGMSSQLRRLGLSDTKFQLKYHTPKCSGLRAFKEYSSRQSKVAPFNEGGRSRDMPELVLGLAIGLLSRRQKEQCGVSQHDRNPTKYVCLESNCLNRTGCSYCFLQGHQNHLKVEAKSCLRDLQDLRNKMQANRQLLSSQIIIRKTELLASIDKEVTNIRDDFLTNLDTLHRKIKESIQVRFSSNVESYTSNPSTATKETKIEESIRQLQYDHSDDLITCFMLDSKVQPRSRANTQHKSTKRQTQDTLTRQEQQRLLGKLSRLNLTQVQEYLKHQGSQIRQFLNSCKIYQEYFLQLSTSLSQFLSAFRRAIPAPRTFSVGLTTPQILQPFPLRRD